jgi:hypothetical protein
MSYGYPRKSRHGRRRPRHRYEREYDREVLRDRMRGPEHFSRQPGEWAGDAMSAGLGLALLFHGGLLTVACGALFALVIAAQCLADSRKKARQSDLATRKALHVLHDHARHRPPTAEMLRKYWAASRKSLENKILLGSLMGDLAVTVDASYVRGDDGEIIGRQGGIKGWMEKNAPDMLRHYKSLMAYKALADKFRLYCGVQEPDGAEEALGMTIPEHGQTAREKPERHPKAAELLSACRTMTALQSVVCDGLGLVRVRRRTA